MNSQEDLSLKKCFLYSLIVSIGISAAMGILAILMGDFGQFEMRVLLTTLTISAASLCGLCCGAAIEIRGPSWMSVPGIGLSGLAALFLIAGIWIEPHSDGFWKTTASVCVFAVAFSHVSLLTIARLSSSYQWAMSAAYIIIFALAALLFGLIWEGFEGEIEMRLLGVLGVLDAAITLIVPIFHRLSQTDRDPNSLPTPKEIDREIEELETRLVALKELKQTLVDSNSAGYVPRP